MIVLRLKNALGWGNTNAIRAGLHYDLVMVLIPAGSFQMGSENHFRWESPRHEVWIDAFEIAPAPVTRVEYARFLTGSGHPEPTGWREETFHGDDRPVVGVSWFAAGSYCEWLSGVSGKVFRLPTEAEWEKACRGGLQGIEYSWGNESPASIEYFDGDWKGPRPVAQWRPNGYGLFNIGDNVHEWCSDWYAEDYYAVSPERNPAGPENGTRRVSRGGSWRHQIKASRAAHRSSLPPQMAYTDYGFRIARSL
jgi:formylglycine-generating enzyme required for sulfatase activity